MLIKYIQVRETQGVVGISCRTQRAKIIITKILLFLQQNTFFMHLFNSFIHARAHVALYAFFFFRLGHHQMTVSVVGGAEGVTLKCQTLTD